MSIEIRRTEDCGIECDWGTFEHSQPRPERGQVAHLLLVTPEMVARLLEHGPRDFHGATHTATTDDDRTFLHVEYQGQRWTWEVFEAHWWDHRDPPIMVGKWLD